LADLANVAARDTFGQSVSYTPAATGIAESITAPFDAAHEVMSLDAEQPISSTAPVIDVRLADLSVAPAQGDLCTVGGTDYEVTDVQPGQVGGTAHLMLVEVS